MGRGLQEPSDEPRARPAKKFSLKERDGDGNERLDAKSRTTGPGSSVTEHRRKPPTYMEAAEPRETPGNLSR